LGTETVNVEVSSSTSKTISFFIIASSGGDVISYMAAYSIYAHSILSEFNMCTQCRPHGKHWVQSVSCTQCRPYGENLVQSVIWTQCRPPG